MDTHLVNTQLADSQLVDSSEEWRFGLAVEMFKLLGDETRLRILWALLHGEHSVGDLAEHVGARPTAVSQQLAKLRAARVVKVRRDGNRMFYEAENDHVRALVEQALSHADHVVGVGPAHRDGRQVGVATKSRPA